MKKAIIGGIFTALATVVLCLCLTACSTSFSGTYKFYSMSYEENGMKIELKAGDTYMNMITLSEDYLVMTVNEDNTFTMTSMGQTESGTWKEEDGKYYLTSSDDDTLEATVSGNTVTFEMEGIKVVLKK